MKKIILTALVVAFSMQTVALQAMESTSQPATQEATQSAAEMHEALKRLGTFNPIEFQKIFIALTQAKNNTSLVESSIFSSIPAEILENPKALQTFLLAMMILRKKMAEPQTATITLDEQFPNLRNSY